MPNLEDLLHDAAATPAGEPDLGALEHALGRRRRSRRTAVAAAGALAMVAALVALPTALHGVRQRVTVRPGAVPSVGPNRFVTVTPVYLPPGVTQSDTTVVDEYTRMPGETRWQTVTYARWAGGATPRPYPDASPGVAQTGSLVVSVVDDAIPYPVADILRTVPAAKAETVGGTPAVYLPQATAGSVPPPPGGGVLAWQLAPGKIAAIRGTGVDEATLLTAGAALRLADDITLSASLVPPPTGFAIYGPQSSGDVSQNPGDYVEVPAGQSLDWGYGCGTGCPFLSIEADNTPLTPAAYASAVAPGEPTTPVAVRGKPGLYLASRNEVVWPERDGLLLNVTLMGPPGRDELLKICEGLTIAP